MKKLYTLLFGLFLLSGCSSTTISGAWKDPQLSGEKLQNVLVVGIAKNDLMKRIYEDSFVQAFKKRGVSGIASYTIIPVEKQGDVNFIRQQVNDKRFDYVLITSLVDKKTIEIIHPGTTTIEGSRSYYGATPYYRNYGNYYNRGYTTIQTMPASKSEVDVVILETNIYSGASEELIYSVQTETMLYNQTEESVREVVQTITCNLKKNNLL